MAPKENRKMTSWKILEILENAGKFVWRNEDFEEI